MTDTVEGAIAGKGSFRRRGRRHGNNNLTHHEINTAQSSFNFFS